MQDIQCDLIMLSAILLYGLIKENISVDLFVMCYRM